MKPILLLPFALLILSCGVSSEQVVEKRSLSFSMDTVVVDSKDEILYLKRNLSSASLSPDGRYLYNFDQDQSAIEVIDLDELAFVHRHPFEKEGPDGVGNYVSSLTPLQNEQVYISSFQAHGIFDLQGRKVHDFNVKNSPLLADTRERGESLATGHVLESTPGSLYGIFQQFDYASMAFAKVNFEAQAFRSWELPEFSYLPDFFVKQVDDTGRPIGILGPGTFSLAADNKIILSNTAAADLYIYDAAMDSLYFKTYQPQLTEDRKKAVFPKTISSDKEFNETLKALRSEIDFQNLIWDKDNRVYYRFSFFYVPSETKLTSKVFLTLLDEDFEVLAEREMTELLRAPNHAFAKDGQLWLFQNIEDEMGFVRMTFAD